MALNLAVSTTIAAILDGGVKVRGALDVFATGDADAAARADSSGATGVATAIAIDVAIVSLTALLGGKVEVGGHVTVKTSIAGSAVTPGQAAPTATALSGAGSHEGVGPAGAFALLVSVFVSTASILPTAEIHAGNSDVRVLAQANSHAKANASAGVTGTGVGAVIAISVATNIVTASLAGHIVSARDVKVLAAADADWADSSQPVYLTESVATGGAVNATSAGSTIVPAVAIALAVNVTVAAILPGARVGVTKPAVTGTDPSPEVPATPVHDVLVKAAPDADTTSQAQVGTRTSTDSGGSVIAGAATAGGPLAITGAIDTTVALSAGQIDATRTVAGLDDGTVRVLAETLDNSKATATAGKAGVKADGASAKSQVVGFVDEVKGLAKGLELVRSGPSTLLPTDVNPVPADLNLPVLPTVPSLATPDVVSDPAGTATTVPGVELELGAATAINLHVSTTLSAVPAGGITVDGPLTVLATSDTTPEANANANTSGIVGVATALAVNVAVVSMTALLGGTVHTNGDITVRTKLGGDGEATPKAIARSGAGSHTGVGAAGAVAISVSAWVSTAVVLPTAVLYAGATMAMPYDVIVHAHANQKAQASATAGTTGVGAVVAVTVATNITTAALGGTVWRADDVKVLAAADADDPVEFPAPAYDTKAYAEAGVLTSSSVPAAVAPAVAIAVGVNVTLAVLLPGARIGRDEAAADEVLVKAAPIANTEADSYGRTTAQGSAIATVGAVLALNIALDTTVAVSSGSVNAERFDVLATTLDKSDAYAKAGSKGATPGAEPQADKQVRRWLDLLGTTAVGLAEAAPGKLPTGALLPNGTIPRPVALPALPSPYPALPTTSTSTSALPTGASIPTIPTLPSISTPYGFAGAAGAIAANLAVSNTISAILAGEIDVTTDLVVLAEADPTAHAKADASAVDGTVGVAAAIAVNVAFVGIVAIIGVGNVDVDADSLTVESRIADDTGSLTDGVLKLDAEAYSGVGNAGVGIAGAIAINAVASVMAALMVDNIVLNVTGAVEVKATSNTVSDATASSVTSASDDSVGLGPSVAVDIATHITLAAALGGRFNESPDTVDVKALVTDHQATAKARAGAAATVGAAGAIAIGATANFTFALFLPAVNTSSVFVTNGVTVLADHTAHQLADADAKVDSDTAGVGLAVAIGIWVDGAIALLGRSVSATTVLVEGKTRTPNTAHARAGQDDRNPQFAVLCAVLKKDCANATDQLENQTKFVTDLTDTVKPASLPLFGDTLVKLIVPVLNGNLATTATADDIAIPATKELPVPTPPISLITKALETVDVPIPDVGVAAATAVNTSTLITAALIGPAAVVVARTGAIDVLSTAHDHAQADAIGTSVGSTAGIALGVAMNIGVVLNVALVGLAADLDAKTDVNVKSLTTGPDPDDLIDPDDNFADGPFDPSMLFRAEAYGGGLATGVAGAGALAINVVSSVTVARISEAAKVRSERDITVQALVGHITEALAGAGSLGLLAGAGAGIAVNNLTVSAIAQVGIAAKLDAPRKILVDAYSVESMDAQAAAGAGGLVAGVAGSITVNILTTIVNASVLGAAKLNKDPESGLTLDCPGTPVTTPMTTCQDVEVLATSDTYINALAGTGAIGLGGGAGASANVGVVAKATTALLMGDSKAENDVVVRAASREFILSIAVAASVAALASVAGSLALFVVAPQTLASINTATVSAKGSVLVSATDDNKTVLLGGAASGAGLVSAGAGVGVATVAKTTTALVTAATITAQGLGEAIATDDCTPCRGLIIEAVSEDTIVILGFAAGGAAGAAISGVLAVVAIVNITTATITAATVNPTSSPIGDEQQTVKIFARDDTLVVTVALARATGGLAGVGAGIGGGVIAKLTQASIGLATTINSNGSVSVRAVSHELLVSVEVAGSTGGVNASASVGVWVLAITTRAQIGALPAAGSGDVISSPTGLTTVTAAGNITVDADAYLQLNVLSGALSSGGLVGVGASPEVAVVTKITDAYVGSDVSLTARGRRNTAAAFNGSYTVTSVPGPVTETDKDKQRTITNPGSSGATIVDKITFLIGQVADLDVAPPGKLSGANVSSDTDADTNSGAVNDPAFENKVSHSPATTDVHGIAVTASNRDDLATVAAAGALGATIGATITAGVVVLVATTTAVVDARSVVAEDAVDNVDTGQSILVIAANDTFRLGIVLGVAATVGVAGNVGVSVTAATIITKAGLDAATARATGDVLVIADNNTKIITVTIGAAVSGYLSVGGSLGATVLVSTTDAYIGKLASPNVDAGGQVLVSAVDDTLIVTVIGNVAIGGAGAGIGASAALTVVLKTTNAKIGGTSTKVDAKGNTTAALTGISNGTISGTSLPSASQRGVVVQASTSEEIYLLTVNGAGGLLVGLSGAISLTVIKSDTTAAVAGGAEINRDSADPDVAANNVNAAQDVSVNALNRLVVFAFAGGVAVGGVGLAGGVDIGVVLSNTKASIGENAKVKAKRNVNINALAVKRIITIGLSGAGGVVAVAGSVSIWAIGVPLDPTYEVKKSGDEGGDGGSSEDDAVNTSTASCTDDYDGTTEESDANLGCTTDQLGDIINGPTKANGSGGTTTAQGVGDIASGASILDGLSSKGDFGDLLKRAYGATKGTAKLGTVQTQATDAVGKVTGAATKTASEIGAVFNPASPISGAATTGEVAAGATVTAGGSVNVRAKDDFGITAVVGSVQASAVGIGASLSLVLIGIKTNAQVLGAEIRAGPGGAVNIDANQRITVDGAAFAGGFSAFASLGAQLIFVKDSSSVGATLASAGAKTAKVDGAGSLSVKATSNRTYTPVLVNLNVGTLAVGASGAVVLASGSTTATVTNATLGGTATVGAVTVEANATSSTAPVVFGLSAGAVALTGAIAWVEVTGSVSAKVEGTNLTVSGALSISALSTQTTDAVVTGATFSGLVAGGVSIGWVVLSPTVAATLTSTGTSEAGSISVTARHNHDGTSPNGTGAKVTTIAAGGSAVAVVGAVSFIKTEPSVTARLGGTVRTTGNVDVTAKGGYLAQSENIAIAVGVVGLGLSAAFADVKGTTTAKIDDSSKIGETGLKAGAVTVTAVGVSEAITRATSGAGGALVAAGGLTDAKIDSSAKATVGDDVKVYATGALSIAAAERPRARANTEGISVGGIGVGLAKASTFVDVDVEASLGDDADLQTGGLQVTAVRELPTSADNRTAESVAEASVGAFLLAASGAESDAESEGSVKATVGTGLQLAGGNVRIAAASQSRQHAEGSGVAVGLLAAGAVLVNARSKIPVTASVGDRATTNGVYIGDFQVTSSGATWNDADTVAGSGGVIAGNAAKATTKDDSGATTTIGDSANIRAGEITIGATHFAGYQARADSTNASVVGMSGAVTESTIKASTLVDIGDTVGLRSNKQISITSDNSFNNGGQLEHTGAHAAGGGVFTGSAALVDTTVEGTAKIEVGETYVFDVTRIALAGDGIQMLAATFVLHDGSPTSTPAARSRWR